MHKRLFIMHKRFSIDQYRLHSDFRPSLCSREVSSSNNYINITYFSLYTNHYLSCTNLYRRFSIDRYSFHYDFRPWHCSREVSSVNTYVFPPANSVTHKCLYIVHKRAQMMHKRLVKIKSKINSAALLTSQIRK